MVVGTDNVMTFAEDDCVNWWCENAVREGVSVEELSSHSIQCHEDGNYLYPESTRDFCLFQSGICLFDLSVDPCEYVDVKKENQQIMEQLMRKLHDYNDSQSFPLFREYPENATLANPQQFGGFWSPWQNVENMDNAQNQKQETPEMEQPKDSDRNQNDHQQDYAPEHEQRDRSDREQRGEDGEKGMQYAPEHEGDDHDRDMEHDHVLASTSLDVNYTMDSHMMMFVVVLFAIAAMVQLYNCFKTDYKRIDDGDQRRLDGLRISA